MKMSLKINIKKNLFHNYLKVLFCLIPFEIDDFLATTANMRTEIERKFF